jgi:hypothetical protein
VCHEPNEVNIAPDKMGGVEELRERIPQSQVAFTFWKLRIPKEFKIL